MTGGIYGKLPSAADFCRKRLPNTFVEPWDRWLQESLSAAKESLGEAWSKAYLSSPLWCFAVDPGVVSEVGWTGVLATSVDSTGRYYPLTLAVPVEQLLPCQTLAQHLQVPLRELEEGALALIEGHQTVDEALGLIDRIGKGLDALDTLGDEPSVFRNAYGGELGTLQTNPLFPPVNELRRSGYTGYAPAQRPSNSSVWWHYGWPGRSPEAVKTRGLPAAAMFGSFLDGRWKHHGWSH
ncbi:type VI secretion system-associated protein TagF [Amorphus coralli]|uniref:type VI secretion system-associated protein TagF n=1 Tax=Amorphus coralli TaxID=340680 RepID=UPI0003620D85|nr:type VI secretion system-associated protein TagF [Amorphus coralli]